MEGVVELAGFRRHGVKAPVLDLGLFRIDRFRRPPGSLALSPRHAVGREKRKTPRGCERSARGSRTTVSARTWSYETVTADRRACCQ
ncbi:hypothetical protein SGM_1989 [Streptomyces griseoaurantiacus M045]|uniref:Uncharacterized protein n=1 Tax=Streptomyces griseoaurantiacus M045 TaxID=996637 RepID=F3NFS5_9ACTN|nr:hypothetical protein SGM_1989 [Streptomyces griseoaurantiacus M045]